MFSTREKFLNGFKCWLFPIKNLDKIATRKPEAEPAAEPKAGPAAEKTQNKNKKSNLKLQQDFIREIMDNKNDINKRSVLGLF